MKIINKGKGMQPFKVTIQNEKELMIALKNLFSEGYKYFSGRTDALYKLDIIGLEVDNDGDIFNITNESEYEEDVVDKTKEYLENFPLESQDHPPLIFFSSNASSFVIIADYLDSLGADTSGLLKYYDGGSRPPLSYNDIGIVCKKNEVTLLFIDDSFVIPEDHLDATEYALSSNIPKIIKASGREDYETLKFLPSNEQECSMFYEYLLNNGYKYLGKRFANTVTAAFASESGYISYSEFYDSYNNSKFKEISLIELKARIERENLSKEVEPAKKKGDMIELEARIERENLSKEVEPAKKKKDVIEFQQYKVGDVIEYMNRTFGKIIHIVDSKAISINAHGDIIVHDNDGSVISHPSDFENSFALVKKEIPEKGDLCVVWDSFEDIHMHIVTFDKFDSKILRDTDGLAWNFYQKYEGSPLLAFQYTESCK
jgi:hypothetical protein